MAEKRFKIDRSGTILRRATERTPESRLKYAKNTQIGQGNAAMCLWTVQLPLIVLLMDWLGYRTQEVSFESKYINRRNEEKKSTPFIFTSVLFFFTSQIFHFQHSEAQLVAMDFIFRFSDPEGIHMGCDVAQSRKAKELVEQSSSSTKNSCR